MKITDTSDLWWKTSVVYCLDVETYLDSNGDGIGDFTGLGRRIDFLADLGVTCLWLMPFYPTADRDEDFWRFVESGAGARNSIPLNDPLTLLVGDFVRRIVRSHESESRPPDVAEGSRLLADICYGEWNGRSARLS